MNEEAQHWINRYIDAYLVVTRQISVRIKERIPEGVTNDQFLILRLIKSQKLCTATYLAEAVCVGKSSITAIINRLDEAGMIERTRDGNDRRLVYLSLTKQGEEIFQLAEKQVQDVISPYLFHFEEADIEKFVTMFEKLAFIMQETGGNSE
ncbi:MarR family winged helix-turn-helix transcriptional regulator [Paenibacillus sp. FSL R7-0331]|uniref:MarR family winged helix-turn-helix transcriptional regulator n=1 Tax=Paenibacillus sp. FSL R7-0331 TaxID=1536773 RepID=UPI0004F92DAD|nr:MarR family transcriptional regulator [Paenibacillus sp. FSL R7-0331]AIQ52397.1 MarR family transcriptional regulator [Paenibacillus sp. FSL R7-0331]